MSLVILFSSFLWPGGAWRLRPMFLPHSQEVQCFALYHESGIRLFQVFLLFDCYSIVIHLCPQQASKITPRFYVHCCSLRSRQVCKMPHGHLTSCSQILVATSESFSSFSFRDIFLPNSVTYSSVMHPRQNSLLEKPIAFTRFSTVNNAIN